MLALGSRASRYTIGSLFLIGGALLWGDSASAKNWMVQAQQKMTCTSKATEQERQSLGATWFPEGRAASNAEIRRLQNYVSLRGVSGQQKEFQYLSLLAGFSYQANYSNDQFLAARFDGLIMARALAGLNYESPNLMTQIFLCAQAQLIEATIESSQPEYANKLGALLAGHYGQLSVAYAVTDWPLIRALRLVTISPAGHERALNDLTAAMLARAGALENVDPGRAGRLYAEAAAARYQMGAAKEAFAIGARAIMFAPEYQKAAVTWRAYPAIFDAAKITEKTEPPTAAAITESFFTTHDYPEDPGDYEIEYEIHLRLALTHKDIGADYTNDWVIAYSRLVLLNSDVVSHAFLRSGLRRLLAMTDKPVDMLLSTRTMDPLPASELVRVQQLYDFMLEQRRKAPANDTSTQIMLAALNESILFTLSRMTPRNGREQAVINDLSFRTLQLDSFTRISLAAASTSLRNAKLNDKQRFALKRFYTYNANHSAWLDATGLQIAVAPGAALPSGNRLRDIFMVISTFQNETTDELSQYYDLLQRYAPGTYAMTVPYAISLDEFQQQLEPGEAVFASVLGTSESYVWGIRNDRLAFARSDLGADEMVSAVAKVRASVAASGGGNELKVPDFEAGTAWQLYQATIGKVSDSLAGAQHVFWYGDGALGALPPAILIASAPRQQTMSKRAEFAAANFLVDEYSLSSLPDLYLGKTAFLKSTRPTTKAQSFAGFGAPLLSSEELQQDTLASSFELAGGVPVTDLKSLAKLPAAKTELESLGTEFDAPDIWLGADASEATLKAAALSSYDVIAFATHGFTRSDIKNQLYPSLLMAPPDIATNTANDGLLTTLEIGELELDAQLVLLSACNTATSAGRPDAEAFSGLAQSFFVAGARSLMVSHWPVASGAASELSVDTVARWKGGTSLPTSLQQSIQSLRSNVGSDLEAHPFFWGPFVVANDGSH